MPVTIGFEGLCAIVSENEVVATSGNLDVLLVDAIGAGLKCEHNAVLNLPAAGLEGGDDLTVPDPADGTRRQMDLAGKKLRFLPGGQFPNRGGIQVPSLDLLNLIPDMKQVCEIGTVDRGCFSTPPTKPVAARVELPLGGRLSGNQGWVTPDVWSFVPKINTCYAGQFTWEVLYVLPAADHIVIEVESLDDGQGLGSLTLRTGEAQIAISNRCMEEERETPSNDTIVYYKLLNPPFSTERDQPMGRKTPNCEEDEEILNGDGIGCIPFRLSRT